jgi:MoxR-like ATPase
MSPNPCSAADVPPQADLAAVQEQVDRFRQDYQRLRGEIGRVIVGQQELVENALTALLTSGHVLLEGVPGLGKTMLVRTLADALHLKFQRIQFTPDLMPADLIGTNVVTESPEGRRHFEFQAGPVFANILLADEINRATPKTQSALLEAMQERSVTVAGHSHRLPQPFFVMATQNPLEMEGTYPLPEAQLDRFCFKLLVSFPSAADLDAIISRTIFTEEPQAQPVLDGPRIREMAQLIRQVPVSAEVRAYAIGLVLGTHPDQPQAPELTRRFVRYGSSPRGLQALLLTGKVRALLDRRFHVAREDVRAVAHPALRHRILLNFEGQAENVRSDTVIDEVLATLDRGARPTLLLEKAAAPTITRV